MANYLSINRKSKKWLGVLGLIYLLITPFASACAVQLNVDTPEVISLNVEIDELTLVRTKHDHSGDFLYVFKEGKRIWKSQQLIDNFFFKKVTPD